jgi:hypothetical protein
MINTISTGLREQEIRLAKLHVYKQKFSVVELKQFIRDMWPAKPVEDVEELKEKLACGFYGDDDEDDEDECTMDRESQCLNFSVYAQKVGGILRWKLNHPRVCPNSARLESRESPRQDYVALNYQRNHLLC